MESFNCLYRVLQSISFHSIVITFCLSGKKNQSRICTEKNVGRINYNFNQVQENLLLFNTRVPDFSFLKSPKAQSVALRTWEQQVAGSIPGSANILSEDW